MRLVACQPLCAAAPSTLQELPESARAQYTDPTSLYNFGWSHGVEALQDGRKDTHKGSFYANPLTDVPTTVRQQQRRQWQRRRMLADWHTCTPSIRPVLFESLPYFLLTFTRTNALILQCSAHPALI